MRRHRAIARVVCCPRNPLCLRALVPFVPLALVVITVAVPARGATLTLVDAVNRALHDGPEAQIARLEADQAGNLASSARSAYWPQLRLTSRAGYSNRQDEKLVAVDGQGVVREYGLATLGSDRGWVNVFIDQLLFDLGRWRQIERTEIEAEAARVAEDEQRERISLVTLERYVDVLQLEEFLALDRERVTEAQWLAQQGEALSRGGRALAAEREQAALSLEEARLEADLRSQGLADARRALWLAIGATDTEGGTLELAADSVPVPGNPDDDPASEEVIATTPELRVLALRRKMEEITLAAVRAERFPTLGVRTGYSNYGTKRFDNFQDEVYVGVNFDLPIFDGFRTKASIEAATKAAEIARLRYETMLETKRTRVRELARRLATALRRPELAKRRAGVARDLARFARLNLQADRGTLDAALAANEAAVANAQGAVDAYFDRIRAWATLKRETGLLAEAVAGEAQAAHH